jgi:hypothetical protein
MNKLAIASALFLAANGMGSTVTYDDAEYPCFMWDDTTMAYVTGDYLDAFAVASSTDNTAGTSYNYAFDITLDAATSDYECDQVFHSSWSVEWTENTDDETSVDPMAVIYYEEWTLDDADLCSGDYADDTSTAYVSGTDMDTDKTTCAYDVWVDYEDGEDSSSTTVTGTTQVFTVYTDSAVVAAASFAAAGVAAMFL